MMDAILQHVEHEPSGLDDLTFGGVTCSTRQRRPDGIWIGPDHAIILELDEDSHASRQSSCELAKVTETAYALKQLMGRTSYRTDTLRCGDIDVARAPAIARVINSWLHTPDENGSALLPNIGYIHYGKAGAKHINYALGHAGTSVGILYP